jgi:hypothetical protein
MMWEVDPGPGPPPAPEAREDKIQSNRTRASLGLWGAFAD